jgi:Recombination endonuclease VII
MSKGFCKCGVQFTLENCTKTVFERGGDRCRACDKVYQKQYYADNAEKIKQRSVTYNRKKKTGATQQDFEARLTAQNGLCAICKTPLVSGSKGNRPCQDHDHKTGKLRDILCGRCNVLLGLCLENIEILTSTIKYLWKHASGSTI